MTAESNPNREISPTDDFLATAMIVDLTATRAETLVEKAGRFVVIRALMDDMRIAPVSSRRSFVQMMTDTIKERPGTPVQQAHRVEQLETALTEVLRIPPQPLK